MTCLYIYRMTDDSGFAPCAENGVLSLACCKGGQIRNGKVINTGLRHRIGAHREADYKAHDVYILGTYKNKMLYLARVTNVVTMEEYFNGMSKGRTDDIYSLVKGELVRNKKLWDKGVHTAPERIMVDAKLDEELAEYHKDQNIDELADLLEVIYAATKARGYSIEDLERIRKEKADKRGAFDKKIFLETVIENE